MNFQANDSPGSVLHPREDDPARERTIRPLFFTFKSLLLLPRLEAQNVGGQDKATNRNHRQHPSHRSNSKGESVTRTEKLKIAAQRVRGGELPRSAFQSLPCVFLGQPTGETVGCKTCGGSIQLKLYSCVKHSTCTVNVKKPVEGIANCRCSDYVPKIPPKPKVLPPHRFIFEAEAFATEVPPYPSDGRYRGRGVVIVGGGKYWPSAYVCARMVRHVGCDLPIQVWYIGNEERDDRYSKLLAPYGVETVDATAHPLAASTRSKLRGFSGHPPYEVKTFAVLHSPFEEVLLIDADNYPCTDPTVLFDEPRYRRSGGVFWPDLPNTLRWAKWKDWGIEPFGPQCGWEVGQYVLNKQIAWRQLNLARWYDDHGDWCYGGGSHHDHGDKGPHRVAWAVYRTEPTFYSLHVAWKHFAFLQAGPDGHTPMFIHRCRSKFSLAPTHFVSTPKIGDNLRAGFPGEEAAFAYLDGLRRLL